MKLLKGVMFSIFSSFTNSETKEVIDWSPEVCWTGRRKKAGGKVRYEIANNDKRYWWTGDKIVALATVEEMEDAEEATI